MLVKREVYELAVIGSEREEQIATLHEYNWDRVSSLHKVAQLKQLLPGLRHVKSHQISAITPAELSR